MINATKLVPIEANPENFSKYGNLFTNFAKEEVRLEKWAKHPNGYREVHDGISGGITQGKFNVEWRESMLYSYNDAVSGDYCFASQGYQNVKVTNEINYHSCGSQMFYSKYSDIYLLVAVIPDDSNRFPDSVEPSDFRCFRVPRGTGAHINSYVWHCPPIIFPNITSTQIFTKQAKVHSKIYYDPIKEHNTIFVIATGPITADIFGTNKN